MCVVSGMYHSRQCYVPASFSPPSLFFTDPPATLPCTLSTPPTLVSVCTHESPSNLSCALNLHNCPGLSRPWWQQDIKLTVLCHQALSSTLCRQNIVNCQALAPNPLRPNPKPRGLGLTLVLSSKKQFRWKARGRTWRSPPCSYLGLDLIDPLSSCQSVCREDLRWRQVH